jgi:hypothetical protein
MMDAALMAIEDKKARIEIYPSDELRLAFDRWRVEQPPGGISRAEAGRRLLEKALVAEGAFKLPAAKAPAKRKAPKK